METTTNTLHYVSVRNRNNGYTNYVLPNGVRKTFSPGQVRNIDVEELRELRDCDGGEYILNHYLIVNDKNALEYLDMNPEPEYFYTEKEIETLLTTATLAQLEDTLNFAPQGVIDLIKDMAVRMELPDTRKRKMITDKTGFNVDNAINVNHILNTEPEKIEEEKPTRKAAALEPTNNGRKAEPLAVEAPKSKYKVIE